MNNKALIAEARAFIKRTTPHAHGPDASEMLSLHHRLVDALEKTTEELVLCLEGRIKLREQLWARARAGGWHVELGAEVMSSAGLIADAKRYVALNQGRTEPDALDWCNAMGMIRLLAEALEKVPIYTPPLGCICPAGAEKTCHGLTCPRRGYPGLTPFTKGSDV